MSFGIEGLVSLVLFIIVNALYYKFGQTVMASYVMIIPLIYAVLSVLLVLRALWRRERPVFKHVYLCLLFAGAYVMADLSWHHYFETERAFEMLEKYS